MRYLPVVIAIFMLVGCAHNARIQLDYIEVRDECRGFAEDNFDLYLNQHHGRNVQLSGRDKSAVMAKIFAECMDRKGWTVASPGKGSGGGGGNAPSRSPQQVSPPSHSVPPIRYIPNEPLRPASSVPIPAERQRINQ
jgi:hypothetical protein